MSTLEIDYSEPEFSKSNVNRNFTQPELSIQLDIHVFIKNFMELMSNFQHHTEDNAKVNIIRNIVTYSATQNMSIFWQNLDAEVALKLLRTSHHVATFFCRCLLKIVCVQKAFLSSMSASQNYSFHDFHERQYTHRNFHRWARQRAVNQNCDKRFAIRSMLRTTYCSIANKWLCLAHG